MKLSNKEWVVIREKLKDKWLIHEENKLDYRGYYLMINKNDEGKYPFYLCNENTWNEEIEIELGLKQKNHILELINKDLEENKKLEEERELDRIEYNKSPKDYYGA